MRSIIVLIALGFFAATSGRSDAAEDTAVKSSYHIVMSRQAVGAGEQVEMKLLPPVPRSARVTWTPAEVAGKSNLIYSAIYRSPFVIPPGTPPVTIGVGIYEGETRSTAFTEITLIPGSVPG